MARDGSGNYSLPAGNPVVAGTTITDTWANTTLNDIASALTYSIAKDGQTVPTANLPMGGYKLTGLGDGAANGQALVYGQTTAASFGGNVSYSGALTGGTGVVNLGSGQFYKDASGNIGFGATPSAWNSSSTALQVGPSNFSFIESFNSAATILGSNYFRNSSGQLIYKNNGLAFSYAQSSSGHTFSYAASGTAGGVAAFTTAFAIDQVGRVYGSQLHNNAQPLTGTTNQYIGSGTYTPTASNSSNLSVLNVNAPFQWTRVGNVVTLSGSVSVTPASSAGSIGFQLSLPIASNLASTADLNGSVAGYNGTFNGKSIIIQGNTTNKTLQITAVTGDTTGITFSITAMYEVK
jgi:hypothetical protein